jgi:hypothetical protein
MLHSGTLGAAGHIPYHCVLMYGFKVSGHGAKAFKEVSLWLFGLSACPQLSLIIMKYSVEKWNEY